MEKQAVTTTTNRNKHSNELEKSVANLTATLADLTMAATIQQKSTQIADQSVDSKIQEPKFVLPNGVHGYYPMSIIGVTDVYCPQRDIFPTTVLHFGFILHNNDLLQEITPLFVTIDKIVDQTHLTQVYEQQYRIDQAKNDYKIAINLSPGEYQFEYGYYLRDHLKKEYPYFYEKRCRLTVSQ